MNKSQAIRTVKAALLAPVFLLCLAGGMAQAADNGAGATAVPNGTLGLMPGDDETVATETPSFPLIIDHDAGLDFDLGGSDKRKLELQLAQPLSLHSGMRASMLDNGTDLLGLDATLDVPLADNFNLTTSVERRLGNASFQSLGSIQCMNGVLRADSYTASGCRFVNEPIASSEQQRIDLGARVDLWNASASLNWFNQESGVDQGAVRTLNQPQAQAVAGGSLLSPNLGNPLLSVSGGDPLQYLNSETSGVDLNFKVGFATNNSGDFQLGLAFAHVLDAEYQGMYGSGAEALSWTVAAPFNSAKMNLEWSRGSFSGGIQGFYRDSVDFLNRNSVESLTTFDVHFTWRAPWNANLSVGASNVMNAGSETSTSSDKQPVDPLESVYGRIPYVRYKQDL